MTDHGKAGALGAPENQFSQYGETETTSLSKIQRYAANALTKSWTTVPHVTHHDELDVTSAEALRRSTNEGLDKADRITPVVLVVKALADALAAFPQFNASLGANAGELVLKKYFNVGVAVETPAGLLVPVIRGADSKSFIEVGREISASAEKARTRGLPMSDMSGGCITVTSLGHIGGTAFTPIINQPELAILGVTAMQTRPVEGPSGGLEWRKFLPVSLSYDHRVINGADAARFVRHLGAYLSGLESLDRC